MLEEFRKEWKIFDIVGYNSNTSFPFVYIYRGI